MPDIATPAKVAKQLAISPTTVRRLSRTYAGHLSQAATPAPGQARRFTADDIATLRQALVLQAQGHSQEEVNRLLASVPLPPAPMELAAVAMPMVEEATSMARVAREMVELRTQVAQLQAERQQALIGVTVAAVIAAISLLVALGALVVAWMR